MTDYRILILLTFEGYPISMNLLKIKYNRPLEREFESWIIQGIENYFQKINKRITIFAFSPSQEKLFPADEVMAFECKIIGLQFKRPELSKVRSDQKNGQDISNIKWELRNPTGQFSNIQTNEIIFYCLPTFFNRDFKSVALDHCIFWRPGSTAKPTAYWYNNGRVGNRNGAITAEGMRWGMFVEGLYSCNIGKKVKSTDVTDNLIRRSLLEGYKYSLEYSSEEPDRLYLLVVEL